MTDSGGRVLTAGTVDHVHVPVPVFSPDEGQWQAPDRNALLVHQGFLFVAAQL